MMMTGAVHIFRSIDAQKALRSLLFHSPVVVKVVYLFSIIVYFYKSFTNRTVTG